MATIVPPRKDTTAFELDEGEDGHDTDPRFVILTLHHGLGRMTRSDIDIDMLRDLVEAGAAQLAVWAEEDADQ